MNKYYFYKKKLNIKITFCKNLSYILSYFPWNMLIELQT